MVTDIMIDLETLDTAVTAKILSIGVCAFNASTGEIFSSTESAVSLDGQETRTVNHSTFQWWMNQSEQARGSVTPDDPIKLEKALRTLSDVFPRGARVWGNGATFDISMLEHAFDQYGSRAPWDFRNIRDMRTMVEIGQVITGQDLRSKVENTGTHHSAADDALWQAKVICEIWKVLS